MLKIKYSHESIKGLVSNPQDRRHAAETALATVGARLRDFYFAFGDADVIITYEARKKQGTLSRSTMAS
jgi:uncharacterized protein with GYD domain